MNRPEATLGEILGAALRSPYVGISYDEARLIAATSLVSDICASGIDADFEAVWDFLVHLPDNMLPMLETPQGWYVLSAMIADNFGSTGRVVVPNIH
ncbi:hypothetical protein [Parasphingorhabdus sp.]|uniref:hypothetical protein n=1 Tax=Parasphingorhabdus sp. TaxID=2709688 RepID=UPI003A916CD5